MYTPPFIITDEILRLVAEISEQIGALSVKLGARMPSPMLRKKNQIKTIHSSLAIEHNSLSLQQRLDSLDNATAVVTIISDGLENASHRYSLEQVVSQIDGLKEDGVMFVFMGTNQNVVQTATQLHIDAYRTFEYTADGMKEAWENGIKASAEYYDRMEQYNKDTRGMSKEERNAYFRDRNKENEWFK